MLTSQQEADRLLLLWQSNRDRPPQDRLPEIRPPAGDRHVIAQVDRDLAAVAAEMVQL